MPSKSVISETLDQYLCTPPTESISIGTYIERSSALITIEATQALRSMLPELRSKIARITDSVRLKQRTEILLTYFEETVAVDSAPDAAGRDTAFALLYFLKGHDRIPDSIPEIGLLDDSIIVSTVLQWHLTAIRLHWIRRARPWPLDL